MPRPPVSCPAIEVEKAAEQDSYEKGDTIKWTVTVKNTGKSDVKVSAEDEGVKLYGPDGSQDASKKAKTKKNSCEGSQQPASRKAKSSTKKSEDCAPKDRCDEGSGYQSKSSSKDCDKREKCGGLIAAGATLTCTGYQKAEKCGTVKNTVEVTAYSVKSKDDKDKEKKDKSKKSKTTSTKPGKVVVKAYDETFVFCDPTVAKDAKASYTKTWNWTIDKTASTEKVDSTAATATVDYTVKVTKSGPTYSDVKVVGTIDVTNPYHFGVDVKVTDALPGATCTVDGSAEKSATIGSGKTSFPYLCTMAAPPAAGAENVATATFKVNGVDGTAQGKSSVATGDVTEVNGTVDVKDYVLKLGTPDSIFVPEELLGTTSESKEFKYSRTFPVPATNCQSYKNIAGVYSPGTPAGKPDDDGEGTTTHDVASKTSTDNTESTETGPKPPGPTTAVLLDSDSWTVQICRKVLDLTVTKTVAGSHQITYGWTITKTVDANAKAAPNSPFSAPFTYTVTVTKDSGANVYGVTGVITVANSNVGIAAEQVAVTDAIPGMTCTVTNGAAGDGVKDTIPAGGSETFSYSCTSTSVPTTLTNTATVNWVAAGVPQTDASGPVPFTFPSPTLIHNSVNVTDTVGSGSPTALGTGAVSVTTPFTYTNTVAGSSDPNVNCGAPVKNTATFVSVDPGLTGSASQTVEVCKVLPPSAFVAGTTTNPAAAITGTPANRAALRLSKTGPGAATAGQLVNYRIKVTNRSKIAARNVVLRDILPSGFSVSGKLKGASISKGRISWKVGTLAAGKSKTVGVKLRIDRSVGGRRCNQAVATAGNARTVRDTQCTRIAAVAGAIEPGVTG